MLAEIEAGKFTFSRALEDIHMNVESRLQGADRRRRPGGCTRRARATTRWRPISGSMCATRSTRCSAQIKTLQLALVDRAEEEAETIMPGFTHLQTAQPVTFGHHLLGLCRDARAATPGASPMRARGSTKARSARRRWPARPIPIDRDMTATALGFDRPTANSLDAVSDRDFILETLAAASHLRHAPLAASPRSW